MSSLEMAGKAWSEVINQAGSNMYLTDIEINLVFSNGNLIDISTGARCRNIVCRGTLPAVRDKGRLAMSLFGKLVTKSRSEGYTGFVSVKLQVNRGVVYKIKLGMEQNYEEGKAA